MILPPATLGVLGGGQLGRYFVIAAHELGYRVAVLDPDRQSTAGRIADEHLIAAYDEPQALERMASICAAVTTEFESVPAAALAYLAAIEKSSAGAKMLIEIRKLQPQNDDQRELKSQALQISSDLMNLRWLMIERWNKSLPRVVLLVLASWLAILFTSFGLFARRNATVVTALSLSALSVSGAVLLIMELNDPLSGTIKASADPFYKALEFIGK